MAENEVENEYIPKAKTVTIQATSRMSIQIKGNYFTFEFSEQRSIPDVKDVDIEEEKIALWNDVNAQIEDQADLAVKVFNN